MPTYQVAPAITHFTLYDNYYAARAVRINFFGKVEWSIWTPGTEKLWRIGW